MLENCLVPPAPNIVRDTVCPVWWEFSLYFHLGMLFLVLGTGLVTDPAQGWADPALFVPVVFGITYFPMMRWYMIFLDWLPIQSTIFGVNLYEATIILIPAAMLVIVVVEVAKRYTGPLMET